ncbi:MAG: hypothetical protein AAFW64_03400 [Pseudomonadota bacterium]
MNDPAQAQKTPHATDRFGTVVVGAALGLIAISTIAIVLTFRQHFQIGGHVWNTADWLINADQVHVRRGLFGSGLLRVTDALGISPLLGVVVLQSGLCVLIALGAAAAILRPPARHLKALLLLSPGFTLLFLAGDLSAAARKEILTFAAMAILLLTTGQSRRDRALVAAASAIFWIGVAGHIANAMMAPMFLYMAWIALDRPALRGPFGAFVGLTCLWAAFNTWYPIQFSDLADWQPVCDPLIARGLSPDICERAISVTGGRAIDAVAFVAERAFTIGDGKWHLIIYPVLVAQIIYLISRTDGLNKIAWPFALSFLPILPLYTVGFDWGRQTVMHITPVILLAVLLVVRGEIQQKKAIPMFASTLLILSAIAWAPRHTFGIEYGLAIRIILSTLGAV